MTQAEMVNKIKLNTGESNDAVVIGCLEDAKDEILHRKYPFGIPNAQFPSEEERRAVRLAERYVLRRGAEGEISHNENGISRTYQSVNDEDILSQIIQYVKVY